MLLSFYKYQGTGNDFILIDNRNQSVQLSENQIARLCNRHFGIGADGLMLLELHPQFDFKMVYYNANGKEGTMCGNGGRCIVAFARDLGLILNDTRFIAIDGEHTATLKKFEQHYIVQLHMKDVQQIEQNPNYFLLDTGSPHYVQFSKDVELIDVVREGSQIRYNETFAPGGVNVNFVEEGSPLKVRTYERGVENETLSCGTGVTASALAFVTKHQLNVNHIAIQTPGGLLTVYFNKKECGFYNITLEGSATFVFKGEIQL